MDTGCSLEEMGRESREFMLLAPSDDDWSSMVSEETSSDYQISWSCISD